MKRKWYPADQMQTYLVIDVIVIVSLFYHVLTEENPPFGLIGSLLLLGLFLVFYYIGLWYKDWRLLASVLLGCAVLAVFAIVFNEWLLLFSFVFADLLGRARLKIHIAIGMLGFIGMYAVVQIYLKANPLSFLTTAHLPFLIILLIIPIAVHFMERAKVLRRNLTAANEKLESYIQEEERHRIARDLHDTLGQTLTMIKLKSELSIRMVDKHPDQAKHEMNEVISSSRLALKQVRELVTDMKFVSLEQEITDASKLFRSSGIQLNGSKEHQPPKELSKIAETMLALSIREVFTNVIKHSKAKNCNLKYECTDKSYLIQIEDDGIGFRNIEVQGNGLISIQERMRLLNGQATIANSSHGGASITLRVPLIKQERRHMQ